MSFSRKSFLLQSLKLQIAVYVRVPEFVNKVLQHVEIRSAAPGTPVALPPRGPEHAQVSRTGLTSPWPPLSPSNWVVCLRKEKNTSQRETDVVLVAKAEGGESLGVLLRLVLRHVLHVPRALPQKHLQPPLCCEVLLVCVRCWVRD